MEIPSTPRLRNCLIAILLYTMLLSSAHGKIIDGHFKRKPCGDPTSQTVLRMIPAKTLSCRSWLRCAGFCLRDHLCKYAIFDVRNKTCEQIYGPTNLIRPVNPHYDVTAYIDDDDDNAVNYNCTVLTRVITQTWTSLQLDQLPLLRNLDSFSELKLIQVAPSLLAQFYLVSKFVVGQSDAFSLATEGRPFEVQNGNPITFRPAYRQRLIHIQSDSHDASRVRVVSSVSKKKVNSVVKEADGVCMWRHVFLDTDVVIADNYDEVILSLMKGYRRLGAQPSRIVLDPVSRLVHQDSTLASALGNVLGETPTEPFYFQSTKTSYSGDSEEGTRYILKHEMMTNSKLPYEETTFPNAYPWAFDRRWHQLTMTGNLQAQIQTLKDEMRQGKPMRIIMGSFIADVNAAFVTHDNVMAATTPYMHPFKGSKSKIPGTAQYIRHPLFELSGAKAIECQSNSIIGDGPFTPFLNVWATPQWFVSTKTWTEVLVRTGKGEVLSGTVQALSASVDEGKNIRVCVEENGSFYCLASKIVAMNGDHTVVGHQSISFIDPKTTLTSDPISCPLETVLLIDSSGIIYSTKIDIGGPDVDPLLINFDKISWFVEQD